jgi:hypothetical protein
VNAVYTRFIEFDVTGRSNYGHVPYVAVGANIHRDSRIAFNAVRYIGRRIKLAGTFSDEGARRSLLGGSVRWRRSAIDTRCACSRWRGRGRKRCLRHCQRRENREQNKQSYQLKAPSPARHSSAHYTAMISHHASLPLSRIGDAPIGALPATT